MTLFGTYLTVTSDLVYGVAVVDERRITKRREHRGQLPRWGRCGNRIEPDEDGAELLLRVVGARIVRRT